MALHASKPWIITKTKQILHTVFFIMHWSLITSFVFALQSAVPQKAWLSYHVYEKGFQKPLFSFLYSLPFSSSQIYPSHLLLSSFIFFFATTVNMRDAQLTVTMQCRENGGIQYSWPVVLCDWGKIWRAWNAARIWFMNKYYPNKAIKMQVCNICSNTTCTNDQTFDREEKAIR